MTCDPSATGYQVTLFWDGLDGFNNGRVEQGGTEAWCYNGAGPFYDTWWEEFPVNNVQDVGTTVKAGDKITVAFPDDEITMVNSSGQVKAQPSALNAAGNTFSVTYKRSS